MRVNISMYPNLSSFQNKYNTWDTTRQGIQPIRNKVEMNAIFNIEAPKTRNTQQLRQLLV
jgi:hypothetical protein